jgi:threonine synthase
VAHRVVSERDEREPPVFLSAGRASVQRCEACAAETHGLDAAVDCSACGGLLEVVHAAPTDLPALRRTFDERHASGVWRYQALVMPDAGSAIVSHPEGNTALLTRPSLARWSGSPELAIKHEGHNPTGSFKDRGMTVAVTQAVRIGSRAVACASTGNTSASLAAYAAQAGIPALVFVPVGQVALGKLTQTLAYGARTLLVRGDFDQCLELAQASARELGVYLANSINPFRVEGQKTIVLEMLQQRDWEAPDFIVLPAGNLGNVSAFGKALREAFALRLIDRLPRLVAVQAAGAAPFARSFAGQFVTRHRVRAETIATAIRIGDPASYHRAVRAIEETNGIVLAVTDDEIIAAKLAIDAAGVGCEPASAASLAGVRRLVDDGTIRGEDRVVAVLTGHVLKDPGMLVRLHQEEDRTGSNRPIEIDADLRSVERILRDAVA